MVYMLSAATQSAATTAWNARAVLSLLMATTRTWYLETMFWHLRCWCRVGVGVSVAPRKQKKGDKFRAATTVVAMWHAYSKRMVPPGVGLVGCGLVGRLVAELVGWLVGWMVG